MHVVGRDEFYVFLISTTNVCKQGMQNECCTKMVYFRLDVLYCRFWSFLYRFWFVFHHLPLTSPFSLFRSRELKITLRSQNCWKTVYMFICTYIWVYLLESGSYQVLTPRLELRVTRNKLINHEEPNNMWRDMRKKFEIKSIYQANIYKSTTILLSLVTRIKI